MVKIAFKADSKPFSTNPLVDHCNTFSPKYLIRFGGFDMENKPSLDLRFSQQNDKFTALDSNEPVDISSKEVACATGSIVATRHIIWRQSKDGLITNSTTIACFMDEVLEAFPKTKLSELIKDFKTCCAKYLKSTPTICVVDQENPGIPYE